MDIRALRQDLSQKSAEAKKTHFSEEQINTTFSGLYDEATTEKYRELAEALEIQLNDLVDTINETHKMRLSSANSRKKIVKAGEKKANKDYDGDGTVESGEAEWKGSKDNAIQRAIAQREVSEATMSKAKRLGHKYPERIAQAQAIQGMRADKAEELRNFLHNQSEKFYKDSKDLERAAIEQMALGDPLNIVLGDQKRARGEYAEKLAVSAQRHRDEAATTEKAHSSNIDKLVKMAVKKSRKKK